MGVTPSQSLPMCFGVSMLVYLTCACGAGTAEGPLPSRARHDNLSSAGLTVTTSDLDRDGQVDQWRFSDPVSGRSVRVERDIDFDGRVDLYEYYDAVGALIEEEMLLDFDDQVDVVRFYRGQALVRRELATGFDGHFAVVKYYDARGLPLRVERDINGDGAVDLWEYFEDDQVVRVGRDEDGDGTPEVVEAAP